MSRFDTARPSGKWAQGMAPGASDARRWDEIQSKSINGDTGSQPPAWAASTGYTASTSFTRPTKPNGFRYECTASGTSGSSEPAWPTTIGATVVDGGVTWTCFDTRDGCYRPTSPIVIGGAGLRVEPTVPTTLSYGGVSTATGGRIIIAASAGDVPALSPPRSRTIRVPIVGNAYIDPASNPGPFQTITDDVHGWGIAGTGGSAYTLYIPIPGRCMHAGARLQTLSVEYFVRQRPSSLTVAGALAALIGTTGPTPLFPSPTYFGPSAWVSGATHVLGDFVVPTIPNSTGFYYVATAVSGASGGSEPAWPTTVGATVVDGGVTWTCTGTFAGYLNVWSATTAFASNGQFGTYVIPTLPSTNPGYYYLCTTAGTSGSSEPTWPVPTALVPNPTVVDGSVTWTCIGRNGTIPMRGATVDSYFNSGNPQSFSFDFDRLGGPKNVNLVQPEGYQVKLFGADPNLVLTAVSMSFDTITSMAFE